MRLTSPVFSHGETIPERFGQNFENVNPPLEIREPPTGTQTFALVMDDPDVPPQASVPVWDHWVVYNLRPDLRRIPEAWSVEGVRGCGTRGYLDYSGPRPPDREHRYFFTLYALDTAIDLPEGATKAELLQAIQGHILAQAELMGRFAP